MRSSRLPWALVLLLAVSNLIVTGASSWSIVSSVAIGVLAVAVMYAVRAARR